MPAFGAKRGTLGNNSDFGPYPTRAMLFLVRALLAVERRLQILVRRFTGKSQIAGWNWTDGFFTPHSKEFSSEPEFRKSYLAAVQAVGADYRVPWRVHQAIWAAQTVANLKGSFLELGTGRGFIMSAVLEGLDQYSSSDRKVFLLDFFQPQNVSGAGEAKFKGVYADSLEQVRETFAKWPHVRLIEGDVKLTLASLLKKERFSFVHIDLNDPELELEVLPSVWNRMVKGGILLLDDYGNAGMPRNFYVVGSFFRKIGRPVLSTPSGQGIVFRD